MRSSLLTFALVSLLAAPGYSQQVVRDDGTVATEQYVPWVAPVDDRKVDVPVRYFYEAGDPIPPQEIEIIHKKDQCPDGWRFSNEEWESMLGGFLLAPEQYYDDDRQEDNGGLITT